MTHMDDTGDALYFRQLLAGKQVARSHPVAGQMANFMYLLGDPATRKAYVVDPAGMSLHCSRSQRATVTTSPAR